jgi:pSer/pThr/pTyr-binding forkhead associated (FHA) protein
MKLHLLSIESNGSTFEQFFAPSPAGELIGRSSSKIKLSDPNCSRRHALLYRDDNGELRIRDLESRNGTFVAGRRIQDERVTVGSEIKIGSTRMVYRGVEKKTSVASLIERNEYDR